VRSRNGNSPFIFTHLALIATLSFGADHYYIGYRFTAKNTQAINEKLSVSKAMQPCSKQTELPVLVLKRHPNEPFESVLGREENQFLDFASAQELRIKSNESFTPQHMEIQNSLTLPTRCYAVEFNNESVTITATK
jgi:hypothetical protein